MRPTKRLISGDRDRTDLHEVRIDGAELLKESRKKLDAETGTVWQRGYWRRVCKSSPAHASQDPKLESKFYAATIINGKGEIQFAFGSTEWECSESSLAWRPRSRHDSLTVGFSCTTARSWTKFGFVSRNASGLDATLSRSGCEESG